MRASDNSTYLMFRRRRTTWDRVPQVSERRLAENEMCLKFKHAKQGFGEPGPTFRFRSRSRHCKDLLQYLTEKSGPQSYESFYYEPNLNIPGRILRHCGVVCVSEKAFQQALRFFKLDSGVASEALQGISIAAWGASWIPPKMLFCAITWMDEYRGKGKVYGGGSFIEKHKFGYEVYNFQAFKGKLYGYVQPPGKNENIDIKRIDHRANAKNVDDVTVVWVAGKPGGGLRVVGWYKNAKVYRSRQQAPKGASRPGLNERDQCGYYVTAKEDDSRLLPPDERTFEIRRQKGSLGQSRLWYADSKYGCGCRRKVFAYIRGVESGAVFAESRKGDNGKSRKHSKPWQPDVEKRKKVELAAMDAVDRQFDSQGYDVEYVHTEKLGWDLEAKHRITKATLLLEVKGLSGWGADVEVTANEYARMKEKKGAGYRLCIVRNALNSDRQVLVFMYSSDADAWVDGCKNALSATEIRSARYTIVRDHRTI